MAQTKKYQHTLDLLTKWLQPIINQRAELEAVQADLQQKRTRALEETARHKRYAKNAQERGKPLNNAWAKLKTRLADYPQKLQTTDLADIEQAQSAAQADMTSIAESFRYPNQHADVLGKKRFVVFGATLGERIYRDLAEGNHDKAHKKLDKMHIGTFARKKTRGARLQAISELKKQVGRHNKQANLAKQAEKAHKTVENATVQAIDKLLKQDYAKKGKHNVLSHNNTTATSIAQNHQGLQMLRKLADRDQKPDKNEIRTMLQSYNIGSVETLQQDIDALREEHQNHRAKAQAKYKTYDSKYNAAQTLDKQIKGIQRRALLKLPHGEGRKRVLSLSETAKTEQDGEQLRQELAKNFDRDALKTALDYMSRKGLDTGKQAAIKDYIAKLKDDTVGADQLPDNPLYESFGQKAANLGKQPFALSREFGQKARNAVAAAAHKLTPQEATKPIRSLSRSMSQSMVTRLRGLWHRHMPRAHNTQSAQPN